MRATRRARKLVDFMLSKRFQEDIPLAMFVFPVNREAELPREFVEYAVVPQLPLELPPDEIEANRDRWVRVDGHRRSLEGPRLGV